MPASSHATAFHRLHRGPVPLLLPNAWDVVSALLFVRAGHPAVGTTSFGVAASTGRPDGARASRAGTLALARALRGLPVPLSVDVEDGYADDADAVADHIDELAALGVAGVNLEDSTGERMVAPTVLAAKINAVKDRCPDLFVNARVDTYWLGQDATPEATLARAQRYVDAGADGVFLPGLDDPGVLRATTGALPVPVNVLASPTRSLTALGDLGVRRVSTGSLPYRAALRTALDVAEAVRAGGPLPAGVPYGELQDGLRRRPPA